MIFKLTLVTNCTFPFPIRNNSFRNCQSLCRSMKLGLKLPTVFRSWFNFNDTDGMIQELASSHYEQSFLNTIRPTEKAAM